MSKNRGAPALQQEIALLLNEDLGEIYPRVSLTSNQRTIASQVQSAFSVGNVCLLQGEAGMGKTSILRFIHSLSGGSFLSVSNFISLLRDRSPLALEETFLELVEQHLRTESMVIIDDLHVITNVVNGFHYPRRRLFEAILTALFEDAEFGGKKLLFATSGESIPEPIRHRAYAWKLEELEPNDYREICGFYLARSADKLEYEKIHRFAPALNGYQLKKACLWLRQDTSVNTEAFINYLAEHDLASNVDVDEVEAVDWSALKGLDDVIRELEVKIALPFENHALANQLQLKPKRGVLLAGPPGTGKTTIGRALAHRLRSKFFLIDGTVVAGSGEFYEKIENVFENAKKNAPSIIFIDDADVIFEDGNQGFYRYLLTMMDGLESASAERICIMMTAMEVSSLPPALLRSGRVELWLYTRLPDESARLDILREKVATLPAPFRDVDLEQLAKKSRGLSGADLKAVVEDAKLLFAHDQITRDCADLIENYFLQAIAGVSGKKQHRGRLSAIGFKVGERSLASIS